MAQGPHRAGTAAAPLPGFCRAAALLRLSLLQHHTSPGHSLGRRGSEWVSNSVPPPSPTRRVGCTRRHSSPGSPATQRSSQTSPPAARRLRRHYAGAPAPTARAASGSRGPTSGPHHPLGRDVANQRRRVVPSLAPPPPPVLSASRAPPGPPQPLTAARAPPSAGPQGGVCAIALPSRASFFPQPTGSPSHSNTASSAQSRDAGFPAAAAAAAAAGRAQPPPRPAAAVSPRGQARPGRGVEGGRAPTTPPRARPIGPPRPETHFLVRRRRRMRSLGARAHGDTVPGNHPKFAIGDVGHRGCGAAAAGGP